MLTHNNQKKSDIWIHGASGKMGVEIQKALGESKHPFRLVGGSSRIFEGEHFYQGQPVTPKLLAHALDKDHAEIVLDFSSIEGNQVLLESLRHSELKNLAVLIGTTGLAATQLQSWAALVQTHNLRLMFAPNTSIGILLTIKAALAAAGVCSRLGFDIEIVETHHRHKVDAPSGTAMFIGKALVDQTEGLSLCPQRSGKRATGEVGLHAIRGGSVIGEHEVRIIGENEEIAIRHTAFSRSLFAKGALVLAQWLLKQPAGQYDLLKIDINELA